MIERRDGAGFAIEAFGEALVRDFDRNVPSEPRVEGAIHLAHSAFAQLGLDLVRTEFVAGRKRHALAAIRAQVSRAWSRGEPSLEHLDPANPEVDADVEAA